MTAPTGGRAGAPEDAVRQGPGSSVHRSRDHPASDDAAASSRFWDTAAMFVHITREFVGDRDPLQGVAAPGTMAELLEYDRSIEASAQNNRERERHHQRWLFAVGGVLLVLIALFLFSVNAPLVERVVVPLVTAIRGARGGYGLAKRKPD